ncbi:MarR family transcriptional regulator [Actinomyces sp. B33]|uniref:MarR family winged helix-turn-helix transcriptional regulator n=1 Tax=Actinomyces sp. B33 TaxID=2942131 RepID=UPI0023420532|nr:MarR family transcriptional regulator [Actinomyces sp. B33]MDC4232412.1 MarR family transcriptional regulator [Actinomyces sp. B33]
MRASSSRAIGLLDALIHAEISVWNRLERELWDTPDAATLGRYLTMRAIADHPADPRIRDIARIQHITIGAASRLVDRLETDGLVDRHHDPADRRATLLTLTDAGRHRLAVSSAVVARALTDLLAPFTADEIDSLTPLLARLADAADSSIPPPLAPAPTSPIRGRGRAMTR